MTATQLNTMQGQAGAGAEAFLPPGSRMSQADGAAFSRRRSSRSELVSCAHCGRILVSASLAGGICSETGGLVCFRCWARGIRLASVGTGMDERAERALDRPVTAGTPLFPRSADIQGRGHGAWPPSGTAGRSRTGRQRPSDGRFHRALVSALCHAGSWPDATPIAFRKAAVVADWCSLDTEEDGGPGLARSGGLEEQPPNRGVRVRATFRNSPFALLHGRRTVHFDLITHTSEGGQAAGAAELAVALEHRPRPPRGEVVTLVHSPTGWDGGFPVPENTVLVKPGAGGGWSLRYGEVSPEARAFLGALLDTESTEDKVERCRLLAAQEPPSKYPLSAKDLATRHSAPVRVMVEAFRRLADEESCLVLCEDPQRGDWLLDII